MMKKFAAAAFAVFLVTPMMHAETKMRTEKIGERRRA